MKTIIQPFHGIIGNVLLNAAMFICIPNDMVMISRLPGEFDVVLMCEFRHPDFVSPHNGRQISRL
jgi:hypothetical protein